MTDDRNGPPCPHGIVTVCPSCDYRGYLLAYAQTRNIIERLGHSDAELQAMVEQVLLP